MLKTVNDAITNRFYAYVVLEKKEGQKAEKEKIFVLSPEKAEIPLYNCKRL